MDFANSTATTHQYDGGVHVRSQAVSGKYTEYAVFDDVEQVSGTFTGRSGKRNARHYANGYVEAKQRYNDD